MYNHARVQVFCVCGTNIKTLAKTFQLLDFVLIILHVYALWTELFKHTKIEDFKLWPSFKNKYMAVLYSYTLIMFRRRKIHLIIWHAYFPYLNIKQDAFRQYQSKKLSGSVGTVNNEDTDEMQHKAAFHQGLHSLLRQNQSSEKEIYFFGNYNLWPLNIYNGPPWLYCIILYGKFHWYTKG